MVAEIAPQRTPIECPPRMFLGSAVTSLGSAKTMKAVAPTEAVMIGRIWTLRAMSIAAKIIVANRLWPT